VAFGFIALLVSSLSVPSVKAQNGWKLDEALGFSLDIMSNQMSVGFIAFKNQRVELMVKGDFFWSGDGWKSHLPYDYGMSLESDVYLTEGEDSPNLYLPLTLSVNGFQNDNTCQQDYYPLIAGGIGIDFPATVGRNTAAWGFKFTGGVGPEDYYYYGVGFTFKIRRLFN
jgi:hypothetical protein